MPRRDVIHIDVSLGLQEAYDDAMAQSRAYAAMARELAASGRVCTHPPQSRRPVIPGGASKPVAWLCTECNLTCPAPEEAAGG